MFVVLGSIAWTWRRRRAGSIVRLQPRPIDRSQLAREILYSVTNILVFALVSIVIVIVIVSGKSHHFFYAHVADYGWPYFILSLLIMMGVQDTYFYWTHRLMHHRALFRFFHRTHHLSTNPNPLTTYSINPLEAVVDSGGSILILFLVPKHLAAYLIFTWVNTAYAVYGTWATKSCRQTGAATGSGAGSIPRSRTTSIMRGRVLTMAGISCSGTAG